MTQHPIRLGDYTSHGGQVVSATGMQDVYGKPQAVVGDQCTCPIPGHGPCVIAEGAPEITFNGKPTAWQGHRTSCGATLISSLAAVFRDPCSGAEGNLGRGEEAASAASQAAQQAKQYDEQFVLKDASGTPMPDTYYTVKMPTGELRQGVTDADGKTERIVTDGAQPLDVFLGHREEV